MLSRKCFDWFVVPLACFGILVPQAVLRAALPEAVGQRTVSPTPVVDVQLSTDGTLLGRAIDRRGQALKHTDVYLLRDQRVVSKLKSDAAGNFRALEMTGGVYHVLCEDGTVICRVWTAGTAPPQARRALIVGGRKTVSGQNSPANYFLCNPLVVGGIIAAAVTIPVVIHNAHLDRDTGS